MKIKKTKSKRFISKSEIKKLQSLIYSGNLMSNVCFNLSQLTGKYEENHIKNMKESYSQWDIAKSELPKWLHW